jgi:hypothetical protein
MKTEDHKILGKHLLKPYKNHIEKKHNKLFILGCIAPDYLPNTFIRGIFKTKSFKGHNKEISEKYIKKIILRLENRRIKTKIDFFYMGILMHYIADAFTHPHNNVFKGGYKEHMRYEEELHGIFERVIDKFKMERKPVKILKLPEYFKKQHKKYSMNNQGHLNDGDFIVDVCQNVFDNLLKKKNLLPE